MLHARSDRSDGVRMSPGELSRRIDDFARVLQREKSTDTVGTYRRALNEFERWHRLPDTDFAFTAEGVAAYKEYLSRTRGLHEVSVSTYLTALRRFSQHLVEIGVLTENPAQAVKGNRRPKAHSRELLTRHEVGRLLESLDDDTQLGRRDQAIVYLMLFAGLSEIEIVRANIQDLEQTLMGWYLRVQGKGRLEKDQQVPVDSLVMDKIRLYLDTRRIRPDAPLFVSHGHRSEGARLNTRTVRSRINHYLEEAGINREGVTPHSLTHTAAAIWLKEGMSVEEVKRRMRHGRLATTRIYLRGNDPDR